MKFTITASSGNTIQIKNTNTNLGFNEGQNGSTIIANHAYDLNGLSSVLIQSNFAVNVTDSIVSGGAVNNSILGRCPITCHPGGTIFFQKTNEFYMTLQTHNVFRINLRLVDDELDLIDLNGAHWDITLNMGFRYIPDMIRPTDLDSLHKNAAEHRTLTLRSLNQAMAQTDNKPQRKKRRKSNKKNQ